MVGPLKAWKKSSKATHPQGKATHPQGGGSKRSIQERLTVASNIIVALTAVAALVVALITLHMQSQDRTAAAQTAQQDRTAAAQTAQMAFANRIVSWWTASSKGLSVDAHIQNDNAQPFEVWVVYLPSDNQFGPGYVPVPNKLSAVFTPKGGTGGIGLPTVYMGQVQPCTEIEVHAPFTALPNPISWYPPSQIFQVPPSQAEGDNIFVDPSGSIWAKNPAGTLRRIQFNARDNGYLIASIANGAINPIAWTKHSRSPICG